VISYAANKILKPIMQEYLESQGMLMDIVNPVHRLEKLTVEQPVREQHICSFPHPFT
jgi:hypothetical protein